jgi:hypothetical protein
MVVNLLFYFVLRMILFERTSRYFFVSCVPEDDSGLGSLVFVSAVSMYGMARFHVFLLNLG